MQKYKECCTALFNNEKNISESYRQLQFRAVVKFSLRYASFFSPFSFFSSFYKFENVCSFFSYYKI